MLTYVQHKEQHQKLHEAFDELLADYLIETKKVPSEITVFELMKWSFAQTLDPGEEGLHR
jgi:hypothetical protein